MPPESISLNSAQTDNSSHARPNILVILCDDMGYSDIGCFGSEIPTPNLDRLARSGVRFSQMYNCACCCPTRASLLTGLYPHQAGVGHMTTNRGTAEYQGYLRDNCVTIAEALKLAGYQTCMSGKWHVGGDYPVDQPAEWPELAGRVGNPLPRQRGFDHFYGTLAGAGSYFEPPTLMRDDIFLNVESDDYFLTDALSDQAARMIRQCSERPATGAAADSARTEGGESTAPAPWFLYLAYTAPHWPLHAKPEDIARHEGKYHQGWDKLRDNRHDALKGMGILDASWPLSPRDSGAPAWTDAVNKDWEDLRMAVYAAQIDNMDQGIGRVLDEIERQGQLDNTLIFFLSDNGGCAEFLRENGESGRWPEFYSLPLRDGRQTKVGNNPQRRPGGDETFMSYDLPWANASNTPFRLFKCWTHEGGTATPFIAHWPACMRNDKGASGGGSADGSISHSPCHVIDIMATCLEAAGAAYPCEYNGQAVTPLEGESFLDLLRGRDWSRERPIFFEHQGNRAVRDGDWKIVNRHGSDWELYRMDEDRTELNDLRHGNADVFARMERLYGEWAKRINVRDWPLT